jgi:hypothetical protein
MMPRARWSALLCLSLACAEQRSTISVSAGLGTPLTPCMLSVTLREATRTRSLSGCDFLADANLGTPHSAELRTGLTGDLVVAFVVADTAGAWSVGGEVTLPLRPDWRWGVQFANTTRDQATQCFGCLGSRGFALPAAARRTDADSLWVVWGGNWISHPVVY